MKATFLMRLATEAMSGDAEALDMLRFAGIPVETRGDLYRAQQDAFERMTPDERQEDFVSVMCGTCRRKRVQPVELVCNQWKLDMGAMIPAEPGTRAVFRLFDADNDLSLDPLHEWSVPVIAWVVSYASNSIEPIVLGDTELVGTTEALANGKTMRGVPRPAKEYASEFNNTDFVGIIMPNTVPDEHEPGPCDHDAKEGQK